MGKSVAVIIGIVIIVASLILIPSLAYLLVALGVIIIVLPFVMSYLVSVRREKEKESKFLEFIRELAESVRSGTPIGKSILAVSRKDLGSLTPHVQKLANQISFGITLKQALRTFAKDTRSEVISRTVELIIQAESSGGNIGSALTAAVKSVSQIEKLRKERKAQVYGMMIQGYVIFFIFVAIMLFVQIKFLPLISSAMLGSGSVAGLSLQGTAFNVIKNTFIYLLLIQAFFAGLVIGKLSEGSMKHGIKHSVILVVISYVLVAISKVLV
ncbi:MAG: type II secretion system F family protein [archaeon]|nr:MAG: type II secretion system F family protein [archaeon]